MLLFVLKSLKHSWQSSKRLHLAAILTVTLCMGLITFSFGGARSVRAWSRSLDASARLLVQVEQGSEEVQQAIREIDGVAEVSMLSREAVAAAVGRVLGLESHASLGTLALPVMVRVVPANGSADLASLAEKIALIPNVRAVEYGQRWIARFQAMSSTLIQASFVLALLMLGAATALLTTVFTLILHNRRNELEIMVLVGASPGHIYIPVFVEGMLQALVGSTIAVLLVRGAWSIILDELIVFGSSLQLAQGLGQEIGFLALGLVLGGLCAMLSMVQVLGNLGGED